MKSNTNDILKLDKYDSRCKRVNRLLAPENPFGRNLLTIFLLLFFIIGDMVTLKSRWNTFLTESPAILWILVAAQSVCLDFPMIIAGNVRKKASQGLCDRRESLVILCLCLCAFLLVCVFNGLFCYEIRDELLQNTSGCGLVSSVSTAVQSAVEEESLSEYRAKRFAAIMMSVLPAVTSICSYVASWVLSDPRADLIRKFSLEKVKLEAHILEIKAAIEEVGIVEEFIAEEYKREEARFNAFSERLECQSDVVKQMFRTILMEHLANPNATNYLTDKAQMLLQDHPIDSSMHNGNNPVSIHNSTAA